MSYDNHTSGTSVRALLDRFGFSHLLGATVLLVAATILLGVATRASGAGLACDANWPLCDGGVLNLLPANVPSFFEWIHRVVAMVAGFFIVGTAVAAWRGAVGRRDVVWAITAGTVLTPIQVYLGRETVLGYEIPVLTLHFWTAILIFVLLVGAAIVLWADAAADRHVTYALGSGAALVLPHVALSPVFIGRYTSVVQTMQYAVTLGLVVAICVAVLVGRRRYHGRVPTTLLGVVVPLLGVGGIVLGREAVSNAGLEGPYLVVSGLLFAALVLGIWLTRSSEPPA